MVKTRPLNEAYRCKRRREVGETLYAILSFMLLMPMVFADVLLSGGMIQIILWSDVGGKHSFAYIIPLMHPLEALARLFAYFLISFLIARAVGMHEAPEKLVLYPAIFFIEQLIWLIVWQATSTQYWNAFGPEYAPVISAVNMLAACNLSYFATLYWFFQKMAGWRALALTALAILLPWFAYKASAPLFNGVKSLRIKRVKKPLQHQTTSTSKPTEIPQSTPPSTYVSPAEDARKEAWRKDFPSRGIKEARKAAVGDAAGKMAADGLQKHRSAMPPKVEAELLRRARERQRLLERRMLFEGIRSLKIFDEVVGLREAKEEIAWRFLIPVLFPEKFAGIEPKLGLLLYGPPGTGKTELMRVLSKICERTGIRTFEVRPSDINRMYVGQGEAYIKNLFEEARKAPSVIFIDEADVAMGAPRAIDSTYHRGPMRELLSQLDGLRSRDMKVLVIASTNKPWFIDEAFLRPGRIERKIYVPPPSREERAEMFRRHLKQADLEGSVDFSRLAELTEPTPAGYYSGADIMEICRRARVKAARAGRKLAASDLEESIREVQPSIPASLVWQYEEFSGAKHPEAQKASKKPPFYTA